MQIGDDSRQAEKIMTEFGRMTGLDGGQSPPRRYLWTDAFAVCNYLGLHELTGRRSHLDQAIQLIDQVHHTLGRHRPEDDRTGWISGLDESEGQRHPTAGGLRIGKQAAERPAGQRIDPRAEWDRDGQYFHYLTKWMHALARTARVSGDPVYHRWAVELAKTAYKAFIHSDESTETNRMYWKMSVDLSRPQVPNMGQHDPIDGWITYAQLQLGNPSMGLEATEYDLSAEIETFGAMCAYQNWTTDDPLGLGGLLTDAYKTVLLLTHDAPLPAVLLDVLLGESLEGLRAFTRFNSLAMPAAHRPAFRELGLSIGLEAVVRLDEVLKKDPVFERPPELESVLEQTDLIDTIEKFWLDPENQAANSWRQHQDIDMVMLATSLAPDGYLGL